MKLVVCRKPGCSRTALPGLHYCGAHRAMEERWGKRPAPKRKASADYHGLYNTIAWRAMRNSFLAANPYCAECGELAEVVDHITPHRGDERLFYDERNLQPLCKRHHDAKTRREQSKFKMGVGG